MQKKFGITVLGEKTSEKLYTYLDAEMEAKKMVKRLKMVKKVQISFCVCVES